MSGTQVRLARLIKKQRNWDGVQDMKMLSRRTFHDSWIGSPMRIPQNCVANQPRGLRQIRDHGWKLSSRRIHWCCGNFISAFFGKLFFKKSLKMLKQNYSRHTWMHLIESSSTEVSGHSQVPRFVDRLILRKPRWCILFKSCVSWLLARQFTNDRTCIHT